jgi:hypothetical protein
VDYDRRDVWVTRTIDRVATRLGVGPVIANLLTIGGVPLVLTIWYFGLIGDDGGLYYEVFHGLFAVMVSAVGYLVWYYDTQILPRFFRSVDDLVVDPDEFETIIERYNRFFTRKYWQTLLVWVPLFPAAFYTNLATLQRFGMGGPADLSFYVFLASALYFGLMTGIGIHVIVTTLLCVGTISQSDLGIDPLHPDGLGGMSAIGDLSLWTMGLASIASLGMPFTLRLATTGSQSVFIYTAIGIYFVLLVGIFVYPVVRSSRKAEATRARKLDELRTKLNDLETELEQADGQATSNERIQNLELRHQRLRSQYERYSSVPLYPVSVGVALRFAGSVILPILFILLESVISNVIG